MFLLQSRRLVLSLALSLLWPATAFAQAPDAPPKAALPQGQVKAASSAGYRWRTLILRHAVPSDILAMMHWNGPVTPPDPAPFQALPPEDLVPHPPALPEGVRRIFALQSNHSLLVDATEEGFATVTKLVNLLDIAPNQVRFKALLVAVSATRSGLVAPDGDAANFLAQLLQGERRVIGMPTVTTTDGVSVTISFLFRSAPPSPSGGRLRLVQSEPTLDEDDPAARRELRLMPRINADGALTLGLTFEGRPIPSARALRSGVMTVYELPNPQIASGERLFFFLRPTLLADSSNSDAHSNSSVTVTP